MALKPLNTLIKIHKQKADILRREMVVLEEEKHQLETAADKLRDDHAREMQHVAKEPAFITFMGSYSDYVRRRLEAIVLETQRLNQEIEEKRDAIGEEFSEQKKYEIARRHIQKRIQEEERHRAQQKSDEVGAQQYRRQKEEL